jgi:hypothetical protein
MISTTDSVTPAAQRASERGSSYSQCGLLRSYGQVLRHLRAVGAPLRAVRR